MLAPLKEQRADRIFYDLYKKQLRRSPIGRPNAPHCLSGLDEGQGVPWEARLDFRRDCLQDGHLVIDFAAAEAAILLEVVE